MRLSVNPLGKLPLLFLASTVFGSSSFAAEYRFYHPDPIGSATVVTDRSGAVVQRIVHAPYGELRRSVDAQGVSVDPTANTVRHLFTGQEFDPESDLYDFNARTYDPFVGRFLSTDPGLVGAAQGQSFGSIPGDPSNLNSYAYARNRPTVNIDPSGAFAESGIDFASLTLSYAAFDQDPSFLNTAGLAYDVFATAVPFLPALYGITKFGGDLVTGGFGSLVDAHVETVMRFPFLKGVNPSGCVTNCALTTQAVELQFRAGAQYASRAISPAADVLGVDASILQGLAGGKKLSRVADIDSLVRQVSDLGDGGRGAVIAVGASTDGQPILHAFNIVNDSGSVFLLDGQTGSTVYQVGNGAAPWENVLLYFGRTDNVK